MSPTNFDALTQLFEQITERLIRIETKLDGKADLNVVSALEGRIRSLELADARRDELRAEFQPRFMQVEANLAALMKTDEKKVAVDGFKLDTRKKQVAAATVILGFLVAVGESVWRLVQG